MMTQKKTSSSLRGAAATKQSSFFLMAFWIASLTLAMTVGINPALAACTHCGGSASERVVFVAAIGGNKGGISGADAFCTSTAAANGLSGNYKAWLADSNPYSAPYYRFPHSTVPYVEVDGTKIADDWTDLTDGSLDNALHIDAAGTLQGAGVNIVSSNVSTSGIQKTTTGHCANWTSGSCAAPASHAGNMLQTDSQWSDWSSSWSCCNGQWTYCMEVGYTCSSPNGNEGDIIYNQSQGVMQYCAGVDQGSGQWKSFPKHVASAPATTDPCLPASSPAIGTVCADGTVYAGLSPDGNVPMFAARCDVGMSWNGSACVGTRRSLPWNDGTTSFTSANTTGESNTDGDGNTSVEEAFLMGGVIDKYLQAPRACGTLGQDGYTDWYLPAKDELDILYTNRAAIGNFNSAFISTNRYWSSTDEAGVTTAAWHKRFYDGATVITGKDTTDHVRCVRQGYKQPCANPTAPRGSMIYNSTSNVVQWCDDNGNWQSAGPVPGAGGSGCTGPTGAKGDIVYNSTYRAPTYCDGAKWVRVGAEIDLCAGVPSPGTVCKDGTVFAGFTPDTSVAMYTTRCDAGQTWNGSSCTGSASTYSWNNGNAGSSFTTTSTGNITGAANTATLVGLDSDSFTAGTQPHQAAQYCSDLAANSHSDWYLAARDEAVVLYTNRAAIGNYASASYWTSSEYGNTSSYQMPFNTGSYTNSGKSSAFRIRCVRK